MEPKRTRLAASLGIIAAGAILLSGCSAPTQPSGSVTITYEAWGPSQTTMDRVIADFESANPKIKVKATLLPYADYVTAIKTELSSGTGPDVFDLQTGGMLNEFRTLLEPIGPLAKTELGQKWSSTYNATALKQATVSGTVYGLPHGFQMAGFLWVNESLLKANGLQVPKTYDDLVAASRKLRAAGVVPVAIGAKDDWMDIDIFSSLSNAVAPGDQYAAMNGKGKWTTPGLVKSFGDFAALFTDGVAQDGAVGATSYTDTYDLFADGKAAFFTNGSWNQDMFVSIPARIGKFTAGVTLMPTPAGPAPVTAGIGGLLTVNKSSKNKAAAFKLASYMSAGAGQKTLSNSSLDFSVTSSPVTPGSSSNANAAAVRTALTGFLNSHVVGYREVPNAAVKSALGQALIKLAAGTIDGAAASKLVQQAKEDAAP